MRVSLLCSVAFMFLAGAAFAQAKIQVGCTATSDCASAMIAIDEGMIPAVEPTTPVLGRLATGTRLRMRFESADRSWSSGGVQPALSRLRARRAR
jgi:hypothetical protein